MEENDAELAHRERVDDFFAHYGVKGMKWGVTRSGRSRPKGSVDHRSAQKIAKKKPYQMSNKELKKLNERRNLEDNYRRLNPSVFKKTAGIGKGIVATAGTLSALVTIVNTPAGKAAVKAGKAAINLAKSQFAKEVVGTAVEIYKGK